MSQTKPFTPKFLSATEYVLALHAPEDYVAVLSRNRTRQQTVQRILPAQTVANPHFQQWLVEQNVSGADIFISMNPVRDGAHSRTKEHIREIRHAYLDLDEDAEASLLSIRTSDGVPPPNFVLETSPRKNQVVWRVQGLECNQAESVLRALGIAIRRRSSCHRHLSLAPSARICEPKIQRRFRGPRAP